MWFALAIPASHLGNLAIPIPFLRQFVAMEFVALAVATIVLAVPFVLSGIVVTLALTRTGGPIGRLYAADLFGAALGCLAVIALLAFSNITSVAFVAGAVAALSAWCFTRSGGAGSWRPLVTAVLLGAIALANASDRSRSRCDLSQEPIALAGPGPRRHVGVEHTLLRHHPESGRGTRVSLGRGSWKRRFPHDLGVDCHRRRSRDANHEVGRAARLARVGPIRRHLAALSPPPRRRRGHWRRRRPRSAHGAVGPEPGDGDRSQRDSD